jgi:beta-galactosidase
MFAPIRKFAASLLLVSLLTCIAEAESPPREKLNFDAGWFFSKGDVAGAEKPEFDASGWRPLDLPHDWSIEGPFDPKNPGGASVGYLPTGFGWYRKNFTMAEDAKDKKVFITFDGISMNGEVWINGHPLGKRPYAFIGYQYDLTPHLDFTRENVLAVRVDNSKQPASRWYNGSGIYRHVWLTVTEPLRVAHNGTFVSTPSVTDESAKVAIETTVVNGFPTDQKVTLRQDILSAGGKVLATTTKTVAAQGGKEAVAEQTLEIANPLRWSPDSPNLYTVRTYIMIGNMVKDVYETPLGIRTFEFTADRGLIFNGEQLKMKGMCNHHDLGPLGAALWDDALERRLIMLKEMGCNAIRTAHNPPSPELLEMCDRLGFLVVNETFDEWRRGWAFDPETKSLVSSKNNKGKANNGYHLLFDEWAERDLVDHLKRDRNNPSVIMWSVGNEVPEAQKFGELETLPKLRDICHEIDPTRPVTVGCNHIAGANETGFLELMDVVGYNGGGGSCFLYEADHKRFPERKMYASEVPHSLQTRGEYRTLSRYREPDRQPPHLTTLEVFPETDGYYESSYDNAGVRISARDSWRLTKTLPFFAGEFRWTGFDYIGESGGWPRTLGNFGIIDLCNFPKDTYYFYQSQWTEKPMVHILPHWTWPGKDGTEIPVWCYTNGDSVELFLNGKSLGSRTFTAENDMHMQWMVPYQPGELKAISSKAGEIIDTDIVRTAGPAEKLSVSADRQELVRGGRLLSYVTIRMEDMDGNFAPKANHWVNLNLQGPGRIVAVCNGDPLNHESFQGNTVRTFNGLALAIIASDAPAVAAFDKKSKGKDSDKIILKASSNSIGSAETEISVR